MSQLINNEQKLIDIIFADRNKEYGAYVIRSSYGHTIFKSVSIMLLGVGSLAAIAFYLSNKNNEDPNLSGQVFINDTVYVVEFNNKEKEKEKVAEAQGEKAKNTDTKPEKSESTTIVDSTTQVVETHTTENTGTSPSTIVTTGSEGGGIASDGKSKSKGGLSGTDTSQVNELFAVDSGPEFEGGLSALYRFVSRNLKYPNIASYEGKEGIVYVKFVVDENGKVGSLTLLNTIGYGMDDEALRVVALIPKFKTPAKVRGNAVKTYYQMPIRFKFR